MISTEFGRKEDDEGDEYVTPVGGSLAISLASLVSLERD